MKNTIRLTVAGAALALCGAAQALDFQTAAGTSFNQSFTVTPTANNSLALTVSGLGAQYSALSFEILSGTTIFTAMAKVVNGNWVAGFNDPKNLNLNLSASPYTLKITGTTNPSLPGMYGKVSITAVNGTVSPVPEPETIAMLLAGLGLMGTIALRRNKATSAA